MQALAQTTIQDLHNKLAAKSAEVEDGQRRLQATRKLAGVEVASLQDQLEQVTHQLQVQDHRHVKVSPGAPPPSTPGLHACCISATPEMLNIVSCHAQRKSMKWSAALLFCLVTVDNKVEA